MCESVCTGQLGPRSNFEPSCAPFKFLFATMRVAVPAVVVTVAAEMTAAPPAAPAGCPHAGDSWVTNATLHFKENHAKCFSFFSVFARGIVRGIVVLKNKNLLFYYNTNYPPNYPPREHAQKY